MTPPETTTSAEPTPPTTLADKVPAFHAAKREAVDVFEKAYFEQLLAVADGNMSEAARLAGIDRTTLYRLMERHGLQKPVSTTAPEPATAVSVR